MTGVRDRPRPLQLPGCTKLGKQDLVQSHPHTGPLPLIHPAVTGRAATEPELRRQMPPGDPGVQHEQDPLQRQPVRHPLATRIPEAPLDPRQKRLDPLPQLVRHDPRSSCHRHPLDVDDGCRRHSPPTNGSLHFGSSSKPAARGIAAALGLDEARSGHGVRPLAGSEARSDPGVGVTRAAGDVTTTRTSARVRPQAATSAPGQASRTGRRPNKTARSDRETALSRSRSSVYPGAKRSFAPATPA